MKGWVYIITTKSMPHLVKVGFSTKDPELRAAELNNTGNPYPYKVEYDVLVNKPRDVEQIAHGLLKNKGVHENKEWFNCSIDIAVEAIKKASAGGIILENIQFASSIKKFVEPVSTKFAIPTNTKFVVPISTINTTFVEVVNQQPISKFIIQDGIATDTKTNLMWLQFAYGQKWENDEVTGSAEQMDWYKAVLTAEEFNKKGGYGGFINWRVPKIDELKTLIDKVKRNGNYIDSNVFPIPNNGDNRFWSSSSHTSGYQWSVSFGSGNASSGVKRNSNYVRLVRG